MTNKSELYTIICLLHECRAIGERNDARKCEEKRSIYEKEISLFRTNYRSVEITRHVNCVLRAFSHCHHERGKIDELRNENLYHDSIPIPIHYFSYLYLIRCHDSYS